MYITLSQAKKHLNIEIEMIDDDVQIAEIISVAEVVVVNYIRDTFETIAENNGGDIPLPLFHAVLLFVEHLYTNRGMIALTSVNKIPYSFEYLLDQYKNYLK